MPSSQGCVAEARAAHNLQIFPEHFGASFNGALVLLDLPGVIDTVLIG
jgi:hypothetical protein